MKGIESQEFWSFTAASTAFTSLAFAFVCALVTGVVFIAMAVLVVVVVGIVIWLVARSFS